MSLLQEYSDTFQIYNATTSSDGMGGTVSIFEKGLVFSASIYEDKEQQRDIANISTLARSYSIYIDKEVKLYYHDIIVRISDSRAFRVIADGFDKFTPVSSNLNLRKVRVEEWSFEDENNG